MALVDQGSGAEADREGQTHHLTGLLRRSGGLIRQMNSGQGWGNGGQSNRAGGMEAKEQGWGNGGQGTGLGAVHEALGAWRGAEFGVIGAGGPG